MTVTRSSGSGMRDLPCAGDGNRPGFSCPGFSRPRSSRPGSQHQLLHAFATGQERRNKLESSAAKALLLTSSGAREEERGRERQRGRERETQRERQRERQREGQRGREAESRGREQRKRRRERDEERECQNPVPFKENYPPPRTCHSLIGCSPSAQLSSRERQSTWRENCPCTCADYLLLRTQLSAPSYNGKCECGSPQK